MTSDDGDAQTLVVLHGDAAGEAAPPQPVDSGVDEQSEEFQLNAWKTFSVTELKRALQAKGLAQTGRKVRLRRAPSPAPARESIAHLQIEPLSNRSS